MTLFWPGDDRAGPLFSDAAMVHALARVEAAWLGALVDARVAPASAADPIVDLLSAQDEPALASGSEAGGNVVISLVALLRDRLAPRNADAARWVHLGLTSQDVLDTALMLCAHDLAAHLHEHLREQVDALRLLARRHRDTPMVARTLTQHALPYTFGAKVAGWLHGVLDAAEDLDRVAATLPSQFAGAAGTLAAPVHLIRAAGIGDVAAAANALITHASRTLGLQAHRPWHTVRTPVTRLGDALAGLTGAWAHIANDVLTLGRPEIGELAEPRVSGRGGSSSLPHKQNPVLSVLIRRAGLATPSLAAQLHLAAAETLDERSGGAWHLEWQALQLLARHTATAAAQTTELMTGLRVDPERMAATLAAAGTDVLAERQALDGVVLSADRRPGDGYLGVAGVLVDRACERAPVWEKENR